MADSPVTGAGGSFAGFMDRSPAAFAITEGAGHTLVYVNSAFRKLQGKTSELTVGAPLPGAFGESGAGAIIALLDRVRETGVAVGDERIDSGVGGAPSQSWTVWPDSPGDREARLVVEARETTDTDANLRLQRELAERMLLSALREVDVAEAARVSMREAESLATEAAVSQAAAESANAAKSAFLGTMSHELRTPLNAIGGYAELIDLGLHGPVTAAQHAALARIRSSQIHLMSLITDLLNFVRIGAGRLDYAIENLVASVVLNDSLALAEPLIRQKGLLFEGVSCDPAIIVRADEEKLKQILVNLLSNAIKFTDRGGKLSIGCATADQTVMITVADTGIGIPSEKVDAVFDPFFQVRAGLAGRDTGVGLGLSISRDLARGMGGDLTVESVVGEGSTFTLTLPRADSA